MTCYTEEIFGPVLVCINVDTLEEAIDLINANEYGNGVSVFTNSGSTAGRFQKDIEAGQVGVNMYVPTPFALHPRPRDPIACHRVINMHNIVIEINRIADSASHSPIPVPLPFTSFSGNKKSVAGGGSNLFYGKGGLNFYTQTKTVTSLWKAEDAVGLAAQVSMPTQS